MPTCCLQPGISIIPPRRADGKARQNLDVVDSVDGMDIVDPSPAGTVGHFFRVLCDEPLLHVLGEDLDILLGHDVLDDRRRGPSA